MSLTPELLSALRQEYSQRGLTRAELDPDPFVQFQRWLSEAQGCGILEPNAMTLSTVDAGGQVWSRIVLLKACDVRGFVFFTSYEGLKAAHMAACARVALTFWWGALERQVNVTGCVSRTSREESVRYFATRPRTSQLGACASRQSAPLENRSELEGRYRRVEEEFSGGEVPCPERWGGYVVNPQSIEFWQGRRSRLHDRFRFTRGDSGWNVERLAP